MKTREDLIDYDFQGWPVFKMNLREILLALGGRPEGNQIVFDEGSTLMSAYPMVLIDDGMGYGVDDSAVVSVDAREGVVNIFREPLPSEERQAELFERWDEDRRLIEEQRALRAKESQGRK